MPENEGAENVFEVTPLHEAKQQIKSLYPEAFARGIGPSFTASLLLIEQRLKTDPREFGEPVYHLANAKLLVRNAAIAPVYVRFGVHDNFSVVFVMEVKLLSS